MNNLWLHFVIISHFLVYNISQLFYSHLNFFVINTIYPNGKLAKLSHYQTNEAKLYSTNNLLERYSEEPQIRSWIHTIALRLIYHSFGGRRDELVVADGDHNVVE